MSYRQDCENAANERKENMAREEESRRNTLLLLTQQQESNMARLRELRTQEAERDLAENQRHDANMQKIDENNRAAYEKILADRDQKLKDLGDDEIKNCERLNELLQKQKESLSCELKDLSKEQLDKLKEKETEMNKKAEEYATKAENLKKERLDIQSKYDEDLKKYQEEYFATKKRHDEERDGLLGQKQELQIEQVNDAADAKLRLNAHMARLIKQCGKVALAGTADKTELESADAVQLARKHGSDALLAVMSLGRNAYRLKKGKPADQRVVAGLRAELSQQVNPKLMTLIMAVEAILDQQENKNSEIKNCQEAAREISLATASLMGSLARFETSMDDDPIDDSSEVYSDVVNKLKELVKQFDLLPAIPLTRHRINAIMNDTEKIVKSMNDRIQSK